jgi:uncharacterized delta-60 repeat protein
MFSRRVIRLRAAAAVTVAAALMAFPPGAEGRVHLDTAFGQEGKVMEGSVQAQASNGVHIAEGPGARLVVGVGNAVLRYRADGSLDRDFGDEGRITVVLPEGAPFSLGGLAVDAQGRVLVAGTAMRLSRERVEPQALVPGRPRAALLRYMPGGAPDPSFDGDGLLETDFGAPKAVDLAGRRFEEPVVWLTEVAVDSQGRILVLYDALAQYQSCTPNEVRSNLSLTSRSFVARLTEQGQMDPTFGEGGRVSTGVDVGVGAVSAWLGVGSGDQPLFLSVPGYCATSPIALGRLDSFGKMDTGFGGEGWRLIARRDAGDVTMDASGRLFLLGPHKLDRTRRYDSVRVKRLLASGKLDRRFGRRGQAWMRLPKRSQMTALVADGNGGVWGVGTLMGSRQSREARPFSLVLSGLDRTGDIRRGLGRKGDAVITAFAGGELASSVAGLVDGQGRVVVADEFTSADGSRFGVVIVRYVLKR